MFQRTSEAFDRVHHCIPTNPLHNLLSHLATWGFQVVIFNQSLNVMNLKFWGVQFFHHSFDQLISLLSLIELTDGNQIIAETELIRDHLAPDFLEYFLLHLSLVSFNILQKNPHISNCIVTVVVFIKLLILDEFLVGNLRQVRQVFSKVPCYIN